MALADLFRYSINYSNNNYSTIREEVEMAEVYLQIEKIRFEDKLNYHIHVDDRPGSLPGAAFFDTATGGKCCQAWVKSYRANDEHKPGNKIG